jgi:DNA-binding NarL/FixJ family response regulator
VKSCLIADDHVLMRDALAGTVRLGWPDAVITHATDFPSAWKAVAAGVEVAIVDLMMPGATPLVGVKGIRDAAPNTAVLVVTGTDDDRLMLELLELGIAGFAAKTSSGAVIEAALHLIAAGGRYLPARILDIAAARAVEDHGGPVLRAGRPTLSERQREVLRLVAQGYSNKEIAQALNLAPETVKTHIARVQTVLGAKNRTDAAIRARDML